MKRLTIGCLSSVTIFMCVVLSTPACQLSTSSNRAAPQLQSDKHAVSNAQDELIARRVKDVVLGYSGRGRKSVPAKEAIAAMAAVVGERCIDAAGEIPVRGHDLIPGQRFFSDKINVLLTGDTGTSDFTAIPGDSVFGTIRDQLAGSEFRPNTFPQLDDIFRNFASLIGKPEDWGKVPLSLRADYWPEKLPLRTAFDTRLGIDAAVRELGGDKARILHTCALAMSMTLKDKNLDGQTDPAVALTLTFETINGMAKTAPMTDKAIDNPSQAMKEAQHQVIRLVPR